MSNSNFEKDPRYNIFYHWGLMSFASGLIMLTIIPAMVHFRFVYPPELFFTIPGMLMFVMSFIAWRYATDTELYQGVIIACGIIFYSCFQILIQLNFINIYNIIIYLFSLLIGILIFLSSYDIKLNNIRKTFNYSILLPAVCMSCLLIIIVVIKYVCYA